jgi:ABC-type transport system involved in cytochrome c biogenesis permease subunit
MTPTELDILHLLHVAGALVLMGYTFYALAAPPETRQKTLIWTGSAALVMLLTGLRMWQAVYGFAPAGWLVVKIVCWLGLSALAAVAYRKRQQAGMLTWIALALAVTAVAMVYLKPF